MPFGDKTIDVLIATNPDMDHIGGLIRVIENSLIEKANEEYGEKIGLRNGEYDPYEDAVQFNQLQKGKIDEPTDLVKIIVIMCFNFAIYFLSV